MSFLTCHRSDAHGATEKTPQESEVCSLLFTMTKSDCHTKQAEVCMVNNDVIWTFYTQLQLKCFFFLFFFLLLFFLFSTNIKEKKCVFLGPVVHNLIKLIVWVEVLQPNGIMLSVVSLPNHMFTGQA